MPMGGFFVRSLELFGSDNLLPEGGERERKEHATARPGGITQPAVEHSGDHSGLARGDGTRRGGIHR